MKRPHSRLDKEEQVPGLFYLVFITFGLVFTEISNNLKIVNIILLLISSDFLASDYCYDKEMQYAMNMHENKDAVVIPVILGLATGKARLSEIYLQYRPMAVVMSRNASSLAGELCNGLSIGIAKRCPHFYFDHAHWIIYNLRLYGRLNISFI